MQTPAKGWDNSKIQIGIIQSTLSLALRRTPSGPAQSHEVPGLWRVYIRLNGWKTAVRNQSELTVTVSAGIPWWVGPGMNKGLQNPATWSFSCPWLEMDGRNKKNAMKCQLYDHGKRKLYDHGPLMSKSECLSLMKVLKITQKDLYGKTLLVLPSTSKLAVLLISCHSVSHPILYLYLFV